jgi:hypothetical protein
LTSTTGQELGNIEKCLTAGFDKVVLCSKDKRNLEKVKTAASQKLNESEQEKLLFFLPEELFHYLEEEAARELSREHRVKGYRRWFYRL